MTADNDAAEICRSVMAAMPAGLAAMTPQDSKGVRRGASSRPALVPSESYFGEMTPATPDIKGRW